MTPDPRRKVADFLKRGIDAQRAVDEVIARHENPAARELERQKRAEARAADAKARLERWARENETATPATRAGTRGPELARQLRAIIDKLCDPFVPSVARELRAELETIALELEGDG